MKKALTVANILNQKVERIEFDGEWYQAFKQPQNKGVWFIWGSSGGGKSYFVMQLAKELAKSRSALQCFRGGDRRYRFYRQNRGTRNE